MTGQDRAVLGDGRLVVGRARAVRRGRWLVVGQDRVVFGGGRLMTGQDRAVLGGGWPMTGRDRAVLGDGLGRPAAQSRVPVTGGATGRLAPAGDEHRAGRTPARRVPLRGLDRDTPRDRQCTNPRSSLTSFVGRDGDLARVTAMVGAARVGRPVDRDGPRGADRARPRRAARQHAGRPSLPASTTVSFRLPSTATASSGEDH